MFNLILFHGSETVFLFTTLFNIFLCEITEILSRAASLQTCCAFGIFRTSKRDVSAESRYIRGEKYFRYPTGKLPGMWESVCDFPGFCFENAFAFCVCTINALRSCEVSLLPVKHTSFQNITQVKRTRTSCVRIVWRLCANII